MYSKNLLILMLMVLLLAMTSCTSKPQTYTGVVTTTMCGANHFAGLTPADCVRKCIKSGSQYALMVDNQLYKLDGNTAGLDEYAGETASVFGTARRGTIHVASVSPPKN